MIAYHWLDASGEPFLFDGHRSPLLRDLPPGDSITVICDIETPERPGLYRLQFQVLIEGVRWVTGDLLTLSVAISDDVPETLVLPHTGRHYDYGEDHAIGVHMIATHLYAMPERGRRRILEVGGAVHPQSATLAPHCDIVSIDISFAMSQLGQLYFDHVEVEKRGHVTFITCDAHDPPFPEGTFDGVVMFAALHHFSDPKRLLVNLRRVLKPGGFVAIMCEPFGPDPASEAYLRDLRKGINEQCWTVEEHGEIFISSGLSLVSGQLDGGSLKVILSS